MFIVTRTPATGAQKKLAIIATALLGLSISSIASADKVPLISGTPKTSVLVRTYYYFNASARDPDGKRILFGIKNKPSWATFNYSTGELKGTPTTTGSWSNIVITAWDGRLSSALPAFSIRSTSTTSGSATNRPPTISGTPATTATVGRAYSFTPTGRDPEGRTLGYSIANRPAWASFSTSTGRLSGTPTSSRVGTYSNIRISVSDGRSTVSLPAFSIVVRSASSPPPPSSTGAATLSWTPPTRNTDGSSLTNLAGYRIYYGTSSTALTRTININSAGLASYVVTNLSPATYYFAITAYNATGAESSRSGVVSKVIR
jgi:hypothetical protein